MVRHDQEGACSRDRGADDLQAAGHEAWFVRTDVADRGYGVIRNTQKAGYAGRVFGVDLQAPALTQLAETFGFEASRVESTSAFGPALRAALEAGKPSLPEVDMETIGPYAVPFGGPVLDNKH